MSFCSVFIKEMFTMNSIRKNIDISIIAKILGHANSNTIQKYVLLSDGQIEKALRKNRKVNYLKINIIIKYLDFIGIFY